MEQSNPQSSELHSFVDFLFDGLHGTAYVAVVDPSDRLNGWTQNFFAYPDDRSRMETVILQAAETHDVYLSPVLWKSGNAEKENFKCSNVVWTEFDGNPPSDNDYYTPPSLRVQSSTPENQHAYWRLTEPVYDVAALESINRNITFNHNADSSAWDATQILRPPSTKNHKPERDGAPVSVLTYSDTTYDVSIFEGLPKAPEQIDSSNWQLGVLPDFTQTILKWEFTPDMVLLFKKQKAEVKDRSASLMNLAYGLAQMGMSDPEIFVCLLNADDRWGKFKDRKDRNKRLAHIITIARNKYPDDATLSEDEPYAFALDFITFLDTEINLDYVVEPALMEQGVMTWVGPSGIGKTQISLRFMIHLALGRDLLHYKITKPRKILFFSLEMGHGELKVFLEAMAKTLHPDDFTKLRENFIIIPHGEKWPLNTPVGQEHFLRMLDEFEPDGVFVDSIGSAIQGNLSDDETVITYLDFIDRVRKRYGLFWWHIHHMRKSTNGGHTPTTQDDVYGNQYLVNRATSAYAVLHGPKGSIKIKSLKQRLDEKEKPYLIRREEYFTFVKDEQITVDPDPVVMAYKPEDKGPTAGAGNFAL